MIASAQIDQREEFHKLVIFDFEKMREEKKRESKRKDESRREISFSRGWQSNQDESAFNWRIKTSLANQIIERENFGTLT